MNTTNKELIEKFKKEVEKLSITEKSLSYYTRAISRFSDYIIETEKCITSETISEYLKIIYGITDKTDIAIKEFGYCDKFYIRCIKLLDCFLDNGHIKIGENLKYNNHPIIRYSATYEERLNSDKFKIQIPILNKLIFNIVGNLKQNLGNKQNYNYYLKIFYDFSNYCIENKQDYSIEVGNKYILDTMGFYPKEIKILKHKNQFILRSMKLLENYYSKGTFKLSFRYSSEELNNPYFNEVLDEYQAYLYNKNFSSGGKYNKLRNAKKIMNYIHVELNKLDYSVISSYLINNNYKNNATNKSMYYYTKDFLKFLFDKNIIEKDFSLKIPSVKVSKFSNIPSVWEEKNLNKLLSAIEKNTSTGKRDYAIVLIAIELGMRSCDIFNLKFENINWKENYIEFNQSKTGHYIKLPLTVSIGNTIIDYLKNERPNANSKYIFVQYRKPFNKLNSMYKNVSNYIKKAGIDFKNNQKKGMHSFRHTVGSNLLNKNIPINKISQILGHVNSDTTIIYSKSSDEALKTCFLNVKDCEII